MAKKCTLQFCFGSTMVIILVLLALVSLGITLALGIAGIVVARQNNICNDEETVSTDCIQEELGEGNSTVQDNMRLMNGALMNLRSNDDYLFWLISATGCGLLFFSIGASCCVWTAAQVLYTIMKEKMKGNLQELAMVQINEEAEHSESGDEASSESRDSIDYVPFNTEVWIEIEGTDSPKVDPQNWEEYQEGPGRKVIRIEDGLYELVSEFDDGLRLQKLGAGAFVGIWFSFLCGISSILCVLWSFALGFNRLRKIEQTVTPFIVANLLSGIIAPILFFVSAFIMVNMADYFTGHKIEAHLILTHFFPNLKFEVGQDTDGKECKQWVLADSLVLKITKEEYTHCMLPIKTYHRYFRFCSMCLPNCSTILLSIIVALSLMTSFTYFIDITLISQVTVSSCSDPNINIQYSCFKAGTLSPVSCISNNATQRLHCFRFYRFGVDVDLIMATSSAFAFYLLTNRLMGGVVLVKKAMHNLTSRLGELCIASGLLLLLATGMLGFLWISGHASDSVSLLAHLNILNLAQLTMVSLFIIIVGFLARQGEWMERRSAKHKLVKFEKK